MGQAMNSRSLDLPLRQGAAGRFLPWTIGALLYVAVVALAVTVVANEALRVYAMRSKLVTVTLPSVEDAERGERQMAAAIALLRATGGVISAVPVPQDELEALVEPSLGTDRSELDLPLPRLIDVTFDPLTQPDLVQLQADNPKLKWTVPDDGAMIWTDNMLIPLGGDVEKASTFMNFVYDPVIAAQIAAYVNYVTPVKGAKEVIAKTDPELANNQLIFPDEATLAKVKQFNSEALNNQDYIEKWQAVSGA